MSLGLVVCAFGLSTTFELALPLAGLIGLSVVLCSVGLQVRLQSEVDHGYRGRDLGLWIAVNIAGPGAGGAIAGTLSQLVGLRVVTVGSGLLCLALASWIGSTSSAKLGA